MDNISTFIEYLKINNNETKDFAEKYYSKDYQLVMKALKDPYSLNFKEWDKLLFISTKDIFLTNVLIKAPITPNSIKKYIVSEFTNDKITNLTMADKYTLISNILQCHEDISSHDIHKLFLSYFYACFIPLSRHNPTIENPSPFPASTTKKLCKELLENINLPQVQDGFLDIAPFQCIVDDDEKSFYKFIKNHMPTKTIYSEDLSTQLINNPTIDETIKNELFDEYGCNISNPLLYLTPHISNCLYQSAIESLENEDRYSVSIRLSEINDFLINIIKKNQLTDSTEIDLVKRLITDIKKNNRRTSKTILALLAENSKNPNTLQTIFGEGINYIDKYILYDNPYTPQQLLKQQASVCCNKLYNGNISGFDLLKLTSEIEHLIKKVEFGNKDYELLIEKNNTMLLEKLLQTPLTPKTVVCQIIDILKERNPYMQILNRAKDNLFQQDLTSEQLSFLFSFLPKSFEEYNRFKEFSWFNYSHLVDTIEADTFFIKDLVQSLQKILPITKNSHEKDIIQKHIQKMQSEIPRIIKLQEKKQLQSELDEFTAKILDNNPRIFIQLETIANKYCKYQSLINQKDANILEYE